MGTVSNLLSGTIVVYIGPDGESLPELDDLTPPAVTVTPAGNWSAVGFTLDDWTLNYDVKHEPVRVNESNSPVAAPLIEEDGSFEFTLAENDLTAWSQAINASTLATQAAAANVTAQDQLGVGDGSQTIYALLLLGTSPEGGSRVVHVYHAYQDGGVKLGMSKKHQGYKVKFSFLSDTSQSAGERLFKTYDITAVASS